MRYGDTSKRRLARHAGADDPEDAGDDGPAARVRHRPAHRADERQQLLVNYGTLYPALLKLEQEGYVASEWGVSDNNRRAKYYRLTRAGKKQVERAAREWEQTTAILARFLSPDEA